MAQNMQPWQTAGFALYVHWPFCQSKCPYCDFNSHVSAQVDQNAWLEALQAEIKRLATETRGRFLRSIFFGGGTPSLMLPKTVDGIISEAARHWSFANDIEITLEANPTSVEAGKFRDFRQCGVNRVSVGVQALNDPDLRLLGRMHSAKEAMLAIEMARNTFDRFSFDLIYARQNQTLQDWAAELGLALQLAGDHLSLYQLTIEQGTVFGSRFELGQLRGLPSDDIAADMYNLTQELCEAAGMPAYEVSNHARTNGASRHNIIYWKGGDYLGIGPGAHGRITNDEGQRHATVCYSSPSEWMTAVQTRQNGESSRELLTLTDRAAEMLVMGLRIDDGIDLDNLAMLAGKDLDPTKLADLIQSGHIEVNNRRLRATPQGRLVLNSIIRILAI